MLKVENIGQFKVEKDCITYKNEWRQQRLGKFTSSMIHTLMGEKPFTEGAMSYIYEKVFEELSGIPAKTEVETEGTRWGLLHEATAIKKLGEYLGVDFLVTQTFITKPGSRNGSTPDAIWPKKKYENAWDVETGETKCYPSPARFVRCVLCDTPAKIKAVDPKAYWQVLDQVDEAEALAGNLVYFHPDIKVGNFRVIRFRTIEMTEDLKFLRTRKKMADVKFDEVRQQLINLKNI